jgi:hypothetical protein
MMTRFYMTITSAKISKSTDSLKIRRNTSRFLAAYNRISYFYGHQLCGERKPIL